MPERKPEAPIGAPLLLSPKGTAPIGTLTPRFGWLSVGGAAKYEVEWSPDSHFGRGRSTNALSSSTALDLDEEHALKPGTTYWWRVRGGNDIGWGPWSNAESFRSPDAE
jgi:hypothetical protein